MSSVCLRRQREISARRARRNNACTIFDRENSNSTTQCCVKYLISTRRRRQRQRHASQSNKPVSLQFKQAPTNRHATWSGAHACRAGRRRAARARRSSAAGACETACRCRCPTLLDVRTEWSNRAFRRVNTLHLITGAHGGRRRQRWRRRVVVRRRRLLHAETFVRRTTIETQHIFCEHRRRQNNAAITHFAADARSARSSAVAAQSPALQR